jgi:hypothetical protein
MKQPAGRPAKKQYEAPKLSVYGNLTEMTKSKGGVGQIDGGKAVGKRRTG